MRVGIVGGGQLGRMLALAGYPLDIRCTTLDPARDSPASQVAPSIVGAYDDRQALARLADGADVVTYEFENVPVEAARFLVELAPVFPPAEALETAQDRMREKELFDDVGLPTAPHEAVATPEELRAAVGRVGTPAVLKSRRLGYDGKGQAVIHDAVLAEDAWRAIGEVPAILERLVRVRPGALDHRRPRARRLGRLLSARREPPSGGDPPPVGRARARPDARAPSARGVAGASRDGSAGVRGRHGDRAVPGGRPAARQRDGAPRAQLRALDDRGRGDESVREPSPRRDRDAARLDRGTRVVRHGEPDRHRPRRRRASPRCRAPTCISTARSPDPAASSATSPSWGARRDRSIRCSSRRSDPRFPESRYQGRPPG